MDSTQFASAYGPYIVAGMLAFIGGWFVLRPQTALGMPRIRMDAYSPVVKERVEAAMARRQKYERIGITEIRVAGAVGLLLAALVALRAIGIQFAFPVFTFIGLPLVALGFMRSQNAARTRAATLTARSAFAISPWLLGVFALMGLSPLVIPLRGHGHVTGAVLAALASVV